jgi:hypothetical protein
MKEFDKINKAFRRIRLVGGLKIAQLLGSSRQLGEFLSAENARDYFLGSVYRTKTRRSRKHILSCGIGDINTEVKKISYETLALGPRNRSADHISDPKNVQQTQIDFVDMQMHGSISVGEIQLTSY